MQNQEPIKLATPLDSLETHKPKKLDPALTWLIVFGSYTLLVKFLYSFILPLATSKLAADGIDLQTIYRNFNLIISLGNVVLSVAIIIYVNNTLSRVIFTISALIGFYSIVISLFMQRI